MSSQPFNKNYSQLNPNQKLAVDTTEGPLMVIAGPGTGKTQVLTLRIANILRKHDISPDSIIALTFTEAATQEMRRRLIDLIGQAGYFVQISTFHSFCQSIPWQEYKKINTAVADTFNELKRDEYRRMGKMHCRVKKINPQNSNTHQLISISDYH